MSRPITVGTLHGSDLRLHWSWPLLPPGVAVYSLAVFPWREAALYILLLLATYICVLTREGVQLLAARRFGLGTRDVTLYPFWGVPRLNRLSDRPWQENYIAATGPVTLALIASVTGGALALGGHSVAYPGGAAGADPLAFLVHLF